MRNGHAETARCALTAALIAAGALLAQPAAAAKGRWIVDPVSGCGTTSEFSSPSENIRWYGGCRDGKLDGKGVLIWYNGQIETERNDGTFRQGEFHGDVLTTFPDGRAVYGQYWTGVRHGDFLVLLRDGRAVRATYEKGRLISRRQVSAAEARDWQWRRQQRLAGFQPAPTPQPAAAPAMRVAQARTPAPVPAVREETSFWSQINPLNWGILGFFSGLFGGDDNDEPAMARTAAPPRRQMAAPAPVRAPAPARAPSFQPADIEPAAGPMPAPAPGPAWGTGYDMDRMLDEPHPFAGRNGAWLAPAMPVQTGYQPVPTLASRRAPASWNKVQLAAYGAASQAYAPPGVLPAQAADELFLQGYGLESQGDIGGAAATYQQVITRYPATRGANLARARLNLLRRIQARARAPAPAARPAGAPAVVQGGAQIVATNTPFPQAAAASSIGDSRALSMFTNSPWLQQNVCTRKGIYEGKTGWCGRVLRDDGNYLLVEVQDVRLFGFGTIGISRSTCTGGTLLTWFSRGTTIRVPKQCLTAAG